MVTTGDDERDPAANPSEPSKVSAAEKCESAYSSFAGNLKCELPKGHTERHQATTLEGYTCKWILGADVATAPTGSADRVAISSAEPGVHTAADSLQDRERLLSEMTAKCIQLKIELRDKAVERNALRSELDACRSELSICRDELERREKALMVVTADRSDLRTERDALRLELGASRDKENTWKMEQASAYGDSMALAGALETVTAERKALRLELDECSDELNSWKRAHTECNALRAEKEERQRLQDNGKLEVSERGTLDGLREKCETLERERDAQTSALATVNQALGAVVRDRNILIVDRDALFRERNELREKIDIYFAENEEMRRQRDLLNSTLATANDSLTVTIRGRNALSVERDALFTERNELREALSRCRDVRDELLRQCDGFHTRLEQLEAQCRQDVAPIGASASLHATAGGKPEEPSMVDRVRKLEEDMKEKDRRTADLEEIIRRALLVGLK